MLNGTLDADGKFSMAPDTAVTSWPRLHMLSTNEASRQGETGTTSMQPQSQNILPETKAFSFKFVPIRTIHKFLAKMKIYTHTCMDASPLLVTWTYDFNVKRH